MHGVTMSCQNLPLLIILTQLSTTLTTHIDTVCMQIKTSCKYCFLVYTYVHVNVNENDGKVYVLGCPM